MCLALMCADQKSIRRAASYGVKNACSTRVTARDDGALSSDQRIYLTGGNSVQQTYGEQRQPGLAVYVSDEPITEPHRRMRLGCRSRHW